MNETCPTTEKGLPEPETGCHNGGITKLAHFLFKRQFYFLSFAFLLSSDCNTAILPETYRHFAQPWQKAQSKQQQQKCREDRGLMFPFLVFPLINGIKINTEVIILNKTEAGISNVFNLIKHGYQELQEELVLPLSLSPFLARVTTVTEITPRQDLTSPPHTPRLSEACAGFMPWTLSMCLAFHPAVHPAPSNFTPLRLPHSQLQGSLLQPHRLAEKSHRSSSPPILLPAHLNALWVNFPSPSREFRAVTHIKLSNAPSQASSFIHCCSSSSFTFPFSTPTPVLCHITCQAKQRRSLLSRLLRISKPPYINTRTQK